MINHNSGFSGTLNSTIILFLLVVLTFQILSPCALAQADRDEIIAGVITNFPPESYIDRETGKPVGFAIDIMDEIARRSGLKVRYVMHDSGAEMNQALKNGSIDVQAIMGIIEERQDFVDFTTPVYTFNIKVFVRSTTTDIHGVNDLAGKKVAVVKENKGLYIMQQRGDAELVIYDTIDEAFLSLISGNVDALVFPEPLLMNIAMQSGLEDRIMAVGEPLLEVKRAIGVRKGETELLSKFDAQVKKFIATPEYEKIYAKWYGKPQAYWNTQRVLAALSITIALAAVLFFGLHYFSVLRLNKKLRESELRHRVLVDNSMDAILLTAPDGSILSANPAACRMFGRTEEEICRLGRAGVVDVTDPRLPALLEERTHTDKTSGELTFIRKDGTKFPGEISSAIFKDRDGLDRTSMFIRDISKRKRAEEELRKNEERLRVAINTVNIAVFNQDTDLRYTWMYQPQLGYTTEQVVGKKDAELLPPQDSPKVMEIKRHVIESGERMREEVPVHTADKTLIYDLIVEPVKGESGKVTGLVGASLDITERKLAEKVLRERHQFIESLINLSPDIIYIYDIIERKNVYSNDGILSMLGYSVMEVQEMGDQLLPILMHPEDFKTYREETYPKYSKIKDNEPVIHQYRMKHKNGDWHWLDCSEIIYLREPDGAPRQIFGVVHDITGRKMSEEALHASEERFSKAFHFSPTPMAIYRCADGRIVNVNDVFVKAFGYTRAEIIGHTTYELHLFADPGDRNTIQKILREQGSLENFEFSIRKKSGEIVIVLDSAVLLEFGGEKHYLSLLLDITERRRAEEMVKRSERNLAEAQRLSHIGSHEYDVLNDRLYWSDEVFRIFGISPEDFTGKASDFFDRIHPDDRERVKMTIEEAIEQRKKGDLEHRIIRPDGAVRIVHERFEAIYDENGQRIRHIGTIQDITERKQAESLVISQRDMALSLGDTSELEEGFRRFLDKAIHVSEMDCGGIYLVDDSSGALDLVYHTGLPLAFVNSASHFEADCASARLVMKGKPISTRYHELGVPLAEDRLREQLKAIAIIPFHYEGHVIGCLNIASHTLDEVPAFAFKALELLTAQLGATIARLRAEKEIRKLNAELEQRVEERTGELVESQKSLSKMVNDLNKTMESLRESEERYRMLVEYSPDGIMVHDTEKFTYANKAASDILGASGTEELMGKTVLDIIHPDYRETVRQRLLMEKEGKEAPLIEQKLLRMDGTSIDVEVVAFPIKYEDRIEVHSVVRDITERKKAMDAIKAANLRLIELDRLKSVFLATMSHELRTPLIRSLALLALYCRVFQGP